MKKQNASRSASSLDEEQMCSYQGRLPIEPGSAVDIVFRATVRLHCQLVRTIIGLLSKNILTPAKKAKMLKDYGVSARHFGNALCQAQGIVSSAKECQKAQIKALKSEVEKHKKDVQTHAKELASFTNNPFARKTALKNKTSEKKLKWVGKTQPKTPLSIIKAKLFQSQICLARSEKKLDKIEKSHKSGRVNVTMGSKALFKKQPNKKSTKKGYPNQTAWKKEWDFCRNSQIFFRGAAAETCGNASAQAESLGGAKFRLKISIPRRVMEQESEACKALGVKNQKRHSAMMLPMFEIPYGNEHIHSLLEKCKFIKGKRVGVPLSWRIVLDEKDCWQVKCMSARALPKRATSVLAGAIGLDLNADHVAISEIDGFGNWTSSRSIPLHLTGRHKKQTSRIAMETMAKKIAQYAKKTGKIVVSEALDFELKKRLLFAVKPSAGTAGRKHRKNNSRLNSFAYRRFLEAVACACYQEGVEVRHVNPAYTSIIGAVDWALEKGISSHQGAAVAIARRALKLSEKPHSKPGAQKCVLWRGAVLSISLPGKIRINGIKARRSYWEAVQKAIKGATSGNLSRRAKKAPPPASAKTLVERMSRKT